jgi:hypothetical protein
MRFMMLMIPRVYQGEEGRKAGADLMPNVEEVEKMTKYNEELAKAGALISLDGLHPPITGARITFEGGKPKVTDGPFTGSRDILGGYWIIWAKSRDEAIEWAKRVPAQEGDVIEVRQVFEFSEFPEEVQRAADSPTVIARVERQKRSA